MARKYFTRRTTRTSPPHRTRPRDPRERSRTARGRVDFAFIDADKTGYVGYYEQLCAWCGPAG